jgi:hypothetical protein
MATKTNIETVELSAEDINDAIYQWLKDKYGGRKEWTITEYDFAEYCDKITGFVATATRKQ